MFNGFKMFNFMCMSHVYKIILPKNIFCCPLKFILGFLKVFAFLAINQIVYEYFGLQN